MRVYGNKFGPRHALPTVSENLWVGTLGQQEATGVSEIMYSNCPHPTPRARDEAESGDGEGSWPAPAQTLR